MRKLTTLAPVMLAAYLVLPAAVAAQEAPNPSAVFCEEQGGRYRTVQEPDGARGICGLPGGRDVDAWEYFRETHSASGARSGAGTAR